MVELEQRVVLDEQEKAQKQPPVKKPTAAPAKSKATPPKETPEQKARRAEADSINNVKIEEGLAAKTDSILVQRVTPSDVKEVVIPRLDGGKSEKITKEHGPVFDQLKKYGDTYSGRITDDGAKLQLFKKTKDGVQVRVGGAIPFDVKALGQGDSDTQRLTAAESIARVIRTDVAAEAVPAPIKLSPEKTAATSGSDTTAKTDSKISISKKDAATYGAVGVLTGGVGVAAVAIAKNKEKVGGAVGKLFGNAKDALRETRSYGDDPVEFQLPSGDLKTLTKAEHGQVHQQIRHAKGLLSGELGKSRELLDGAVSVRVVPKEGGGTALELSLKQAQVEEYFSKNTGKKQESPPKGEPLKAITVDVDITKLKAGREVDLLAEAVKISRGVDQLEDQVRSLRPVDKNK